jgi:predicted regulator of Ras-like GTPase activity (Roadblock/LC7/MglB family)
MISESERDQAESSFTRLLREFMESDPRYLAGIFVDREGECVDYCSSLDAYDAKVAGAHLQVVLGEIRPSLKRLVLGEPESFVVHGTERDLALRRVDEEYSVILVTAGGGVDEDTMAALGQLAHDLRVEAGLSPAHFESHYGKLEVEVRESVGFPFAPTSIRVGALHIEIDDVLGHFRESGGLAGGTLECFHVRDADAKEFLIAYDDSNGRWHKLTLGV